MIKMKILGIIPARGGSKGIPDKNIVDLCGKPLISWSIETGNELIKQNVISRCIVSTDSIKICKIAKNYGADLPFLRPKHVAKDNSKSIEFVLHALEELKKNKEYFNAVMILQPTNPSRSTESIGFAVKKFINSNSQSLISCYKEEYLNDLVIYKKVGRNNLKPVNPMHNKGVRRQQHESIFVRNGSIYLTKVPYLIRTKQLICDNPMLFEMKKNESIPIDNYEDLNLLRMILCK